MQEILWQIMNDGDQSRSEGQSINERVPFMEADVEYHNNEAAFDVIERTPPPRLIKTHAHRHFFEK